MNQDLQASHRMLALLEGSKSLTERILDRSGGVFIEFDEKGMILRGNEELGRLASMNHEDLLGVSIRSIFATDVADLVFEKMSALAAQGADFMKFDAPLGTDRKRLFQWTLNRTWIGPANLGFPIYTGTAQDITDVVEAHEKVTEYKKDLELVETVQGLLLPADKELNLNGVNLAFSYLPANLSSGDYLWYEFVSPSRLWITMGDVTGHGAGSAMVASLVSGVIRSKLLQMKQTSNGSVADILKAVHETLSLLPGQPYWMTMSIFDVDLATDEIVWWGAGSPPVLSVADASHVDVHEAEGSAPLGSFGFHTFRLRLPFGKGRRIVHVSDGLTEARASDQREFGLRRFRKAVSSVGLTESPRKLCSELEKQVREWGKGAPLEDDVTILVLDRV